MSSSGALSPGESLAPHAASARLLAGYRGYVLALIWVVLLLRFVDLQIVSVLLESIKREFTVSDTQLGLMTGLAFSVFYGTLGIPVAWLADRSNRRNIIAIALGLWSAMTMVSGLATSFTTLLLARIGVGVGEAGGSAPAYSLVSDYVAPVRRATAFALLNSAVPVGVFAGLLLGGYVNAHLGWRAAFIAVGMPGLIVALLVRFTLREPPRGLSDRRVASTPPPTLRIALNHLLRMRSYRHLVLGSSIFTLGAMGSGIWIPSFFIRVHHMPPTDVATWLAFLYGGGGVLGAITGGICADKLVARTSDARWFGWLCGLCTLATLPFSIFVYLWPHPIPAMLVHIGTILFMHAWMGPAYGTIQSLAGIRYRAMAAAINLLTVNLISYGLGPLLVGMASDYFSARVGDESLRYSILAVVIVSYGWASIHFLLAARTLRADLREAGAVA